MVGVLDTTTAGGLMFLFGLIIAVIGGILLAVFAKVRVAKVGTSGVVVVLVGLALLLGGYFVAALTPSPPVTAPAVPGSTVNTVVNSANFAPGETWTPSTNTVVLSLLYNSTASGVFLAPKVGFTGSGSNAKEACGTTTACHQYAVIPVKLARTDSVNTTAGFTLSLNGLPTLTSTGSNPQPYGPVGYTASTTTSGGVWKVSWSAGSLSGINPSQNAPTVTSGVAGNVVGVGAFNSYSTALSLTLGGANSTSGIWGTLAQNFTTYAMTVNVAGGAGSTPAFITVSFILIGWTT